MINWTALFIPRRRCSHPPSLQRTHQLDSYSVLQISQNISTKGIYVPRSCFRRSSEDCSVAINNLYVQERQGSGSLADPFALETGDTPQYLWVIQFYRLNQFTLKISIQLFTGLSFPWRKDSRRVSDSWRHRWRFGGSSRSGLGLPGYLVRWPGQVHNLSRRKSVLPVLSKND